MGIKNVLEWMDAIEKGEPTPVEGVYTHLALRGRR